MRPERVIPIALIADAESKIQRQTFRGEHFVGPAVIALLDNITMIDCTWDGPTPDALFIEVPDEKLVVGIIGISQATFQGCTFSNIAIIGTKEVLELIRGNLGVIQPPPLRDRAEESASSES